MILITTPSRFLPLIYSLFSIWLLSGCNNTDPAISDIDKSGIIETLRSAGIEQNDDSILLISHTSVCADHLKEIKEWEKIRNGKNIKLLLISRYVQSKRAFMERYKIALDTYHITPYMLADNEILLSEPLKLYLNSEGEPEIIDRIGAHSNGSFERFLSLAEQ